MEKLLYKTSAFGLELKNNEKSLLNDFIIAKTETAAYDSNWEPVWGEVKSIRNHFNELAVTLLQKGTDRTLIIRFRMFDEGLGI
ncbi:MAG: glycoside hydrolase family 97 N-terminal domain-containing protein [Cytophagales bacterium]|nr:glycoside hydrolase family 97 N-terminal domain-containing protein [Cytophagales bacterium]